MFRGFKIKGVENANKGQFYEIGKKIYEKHKTIVDKKLKDFVNGDNSLDGTKLQSNWFPEIDANVFISHSHIDEDMAVYLAGWLWSNFRITSFIDSLIWGHSDKLLKEIDEDYCLNEDKATYDYNKRNYSTSHVHMMLSTALAKMIDQTECLFFLETPNSIKPSDEIKNKTKSAWIYLEITMTQIVEKRQPKRQILLHETRKFTSQELKNKSLEINYTLDLDHLTDISSNSLKSWRENKIYFDNDAEKALDAFYKSNPAKKISDSLHG